MQIAVPQLPSDAAVADLSLLTTEEEIADVSFRGVFPPLVREHLSVQTSLFAGCLLPAFGMRNSHFTDVVFRNCDLSNADLSGCAFHRVQFIDCKVMGTNFAASTLQHVVFDRCKGEYANFAECRLRFVRFTDDNLRSAVFDNCRLEHTEYGRCDLSLSEFHGTRLRGISFADSDIRGIRVLEISSLELKGLKINRLQAADLALLLGVELDDE